MDKPCNEVKKYMLRVISPTHVGNGERLKFGLDIARYGSPEKVYVLHMERMFEALAELPNHQEINSILCSPAATSRFAAEVLKLLERNNLELSRYCFYKKDQWTNSADLLQHLRTSKGQLVIPGSSLKGALRTVFLSQHPNLREILAEELPNLTYKNRFPAEGIENRIFRNNTRDIHNDLYRAISVMDALFTKRSVGVSFVTLSSPTQDNAFQKRDIATALEVVKPGSETETELHLNTFLLTEGARWFHFDRNALSFASLSRMAQTHIHSLIESEKNHFSKYASVPGAIESLDEIERQINGLPPDSVPLRLGWGIGWTGTTGGVCSPDERLELIDIFEKMGKYSATAYRNAKKQFPKTRRFSLGDDKIAHFGFVALVPI